MLLTVAALAGSGCAFLGVRPGASVSASAPESAPAPGPAALDLEIDAPPDLRLLLGRHLDLVSG
jgi:hypothetical protein